MHRSVGVGNHIAVRENHTLGLPGSARCIDDLSAVISIRVDGLEKHRMALHDLPETVIHSLDPCGQRSLFAFNGNHTFYVGHCFAGRNFIQVSAPATNIRAPESVAMNSTSSHLHMEEMETAIAPTFKIPLKAMANSAQLPMKRHT